MLQIMYTYLTNRNKNWMARNTEIESLSQKEQYWLGFSRKGKMRPEERKEAGHSAEGHRSNCQWQYFPDNYFARFVFLFCFFSASYFSQFKSSYWPKCIASSPSKLPNNITSPPEVISVYHHVLQWEPRIGSNAIHLK